MELVFSPKFSQIKEDLLKKQVVGDLDQIDLPHLIFARQLDVLIVNVCQSIVDCAAVVLNKLNYPKNTTLHIKRAKKHHFSCATLIMSVDNLPTISSVFLSILY